MTDNEQLITQARAIYAKAMNCSDLADEGTWTATEDVLDPPLHNYWHVKAVRRPTRPGVEPYTVTKALTQAPGVAGLLTFVSTALPQLCDLVERLGVERDEAAENHAELLTVAGEMSAVLSRCGDWEDGCFYYNGTSATELEGPQQRLAAAIAKATDPDRLNKMGRG